MQSRSCSRSSTFLSESGNRMYIITARRMIWDDLLKYLKGLGWVMANATEPPAPPQAGFL
jgi:hypothetical protein